MINDIDHMNSLGDYIDDIDNLAVISKGEFDIENQLAIEVRVLWKGF